MAANFMNVVNWGEREKPSHFRSGRLYELAVVEPSVIHVITFNSATMKVIDKKLYTSITDQFRSSFFM